MVKPSFKVEEGRTYITVPHLEKELRFIAPIHGPGNYKTVRDSIHSQGDIEPTIAETTSLVYAATQNKENKYASQILDTLRKGWFWGFNGVLYVPSEGAFIQDRPDFNENGVIIDRNKARHIPFGYTVGEDNNIEKNPFAIALAGEEGVGLLAKIAKDLKKTPYIWALTKDDVVSEQKRVASLSSVGSSLGLYGSGSGVRDGYGYAFGVFSAGRDFNS
ncbi:MAG: hypothetical protein Q7S74_03465 [Nanoarchaeota archaeon]|nr:hypothetical protein [Nanoarchaeota archaeon]